MMKERIIYLKICKHEVVNILVKLFFFSWDILEKEVLEDINIDGMFES